MPIQLDPAQLLAALLELGVTPTALQAIRSAAPNKGKSLLDELKHAAKSRYRKLAFELHPDRNGGDTSKVARFTLLTDVMKQIEAMVYHPGVSLPPRPAAPPPQSRVVVQQVVFRPRPVATIFRGVRPATTASPAASGPKGVHVVFLRPQ